jgi:hypothetical protein
MMLRSLELYTRGTLPESLCASSVLVWVRSRAKSVRRGRDRFLGEGWLLPRLAKCSSSPGPPSIRSLILLRSTFRSRSYLGKSLVAQTFESTLTSEATAGRVTPLRLLVLASTLGGGVEALNFCGVRVSRIVALL